MSKREELRKALSNYVIKTELASYERAKVGRLNADGTATLTVPGRTDFVFVTLANQTVTIALNRGAVPLQYGLPVKMRLEQGVYVIYSRDRLREAPGSGSDNAYGIPPHAAIHQHGGADEVATATPAANAIPKAGASGDLDIGWIDQSDINTDSVTEGTTNLFTDAVSVGAAIHGAAAKTTPVDADTMPLIDSAASNVLKKVTWANIKATLKTYLDTLYTAINTAVLLTGTQTVAGAKTFTSRLTASAGSSGVTPHSWASLFVEDDTNLMIEIATPNTVYGYLSFSDPQQSAVGAVRYNHADDSMDLIVANAIAANIASSGAVGMPTVSSNARLQLAETVTLADALQMVNRNATRTWGMAVDVGAPDNGSYILIDRTAVLVRHVVDIAGNHGFGTSTPQGRMHAHDGTGGFLFVTKTGINATAQVIIPNGTGDVLYGMSHHYFVRGSSGVTQRGDGWFTGAGPGTFEDIYFDGTNTLTLRINADGSVDLRRTSGTITFTANLLLQWL